MMTDYRIVSATIFMLVAFFLVCSMGFWPSKFDPRYVTAGLAAAGAICLFHIMWFCYDIAVQFKRLIALLSGGDDQVKAGLEGIVQAFGQQIKRLTQEE